MPRFTVTHLEREQLDEGWPLVRTGAPELALSEWLAFAERVLDEGGGVLGVRAADGSLHGLATYRIEEWLRGGRTLRVDNIVTFELNRDAPARRTLLAALERVARAFGCVSLAVSMASRGYAERNSYKADGWRMLGLQLSEVAFAKRVDVDEELLPLEAPAA